MILFYLFFLASRAIPNSIPRRVPSPVIFELETFRCLDFRPKFADGRWNRCRTLGQSNFGNQRVSTLLDTSRRQLMQLVKTNICRAAVCDKCQKMALRGGRSARPRMVSRSCMLRKYYVISPNWRTEWNWTHVFDWHFLGIFYLDIATSVYR